ncbi:MAG TPA: hypothetical protein VM432_01770 [Bdellovibrionales bacterium]|nr:hypothetical protein [Bdellovibrionales bacterium]
MILALALATLLEIQPSQTGPGIQQVKGPHLALWNEEQVSSENDLLLITIGGTNSQPRELLAFKQEAVRFGYHAIGVDYPNTVISTTCRTMPSPTCFDEYREEVVFGTPVSDIVQVNPTNSIENRILKLMRYLQIQNPAQWSQFFLGGHLNWEKVVLAGHSQGSGHIAYLAKKHRVHGVIMFAGPQDGNASWLSQPGLTPVDRLYFFFHLKDFFGSEFQVDSAKVLLNDPHAEVSAIDNSIAASSKAHIFMTNAPSDDPHNSLTKSGFVQVWQFLLRRLSFESP